MLFQMRLLGRLFLAEDWLTVESNHEKIVKTSIVGKRKDKGPEVGTHLICSRKLGPYGWSIEWASKKGTGMWDEKVIRSHGS